MELASEKDRDRTQQSSQHLPSVRDRSTTYATQTMSHDQKGTFSYKPKDMFRTARPLSGSKNTPSIFENQNWKVELTSIELNRKKSKTRLRSSGSNTFRSPTKSSRPPTATSNAPAFPDDLGTMLASSESASRFLSRTSRTNQRPMSGRTPKQSGLEKRPMTALSARPPSAEEKEIALENLERFASALQTMDRPMSSFLKDESSIKEIKIDMEQEQQRHERLTSSLGALGILKDELDLNFEFVRMHKSTPRIIALKEREVGFYAQMRGEAEDALINLTYGNFSKEEIVLFLKRLMDLNRLYLRILAENGLGHLALMAEGLTKLSTVFIDHLYSFADERFNEEREKRKRQLHGDDLVWKGRAEYAERRLDANLHVFNQEVKGLQGEKGKLENYVLKLERDVFEKKAELQELTTIPKTSTLG